MHACMYILCTVYMFIQANIHTVYIHAGLSVLTLNVISAHDCTSVMQELLLGVTHTKVCVGTKKAGIKRITCTA